ncbi:MAG: type II toxin-antitoxin system RelE/ParE family toxin [Nitrospinae bacterium]|nr:type II toxin-antitoxin system RelE/ParE family toxin [Nitrospinota bacterium]
MIIHFRHKGLQLLYERGNRRRVPSEYVDKIERILARLDRATIPAHMNLPGYRLHPLRGELAGFWGVNVFRNWRIVFRYEGEHVTDVDLTDYH